MELMCMMRRSTCLLIAMMNNVKSFRHYTTQISCTSLYVYVYVCVCLCLCVVVTQQKRKKRKYVRSKMETLHKRL